MGIGALTAYGCESNYRGYEATGNQQIDAFYGGLSSAVSKAEAKGEGDILGLTTIPYDDMTSYGMVARYSENSTPENPVIQVSCNYGGEKRCYDVHVKDVNPRCASQLEMFALCCYTDEQGITNGGSFGSYSKMKGMAKNAAYNGTFPDLTDPANVGKNFDWIAMLEEMASVYLGNPNEYAQYLDALGLSEAMKNWADTYGMDFEKSLSARYIGGENEGEPVVEVYVKRHGEVVTERVHIHEVNPRKCTQQEMYAYLYHYDIVNGTKGSYDLLMAYGETAQKQGYWEGSASYGAFSEEDYDWSTLFTSVWTGEFQLGLGLVEEHEGEPEYAIYDCMMKDHRKFMNPDWKSAKAMDMTTQASLTYIGPNVPREISAAIYNHLFRAEEVELLPDEESAAYYECRVSKINAILRRIEKQIDEDGSRDSIEAAWESARTAIADMLEDLDSFFGDRLGADKNVQSRMQEIKKQCQSLLSFIDGGSVEKEEEDEKSEGFGSLLRAHIEEIFNKLITGDTEQKFQIGSLSLTLDEWYELLEKFDEAEDDLKKELEEALAKIAGEKERTAVSDAAKTAAESIGTSELSDKTAGDILTSETTTSTFKGQLQDEPARYVTWYTAEGIFCRKFGQQDDYLWSIPFTEEGQQEKVLAFLHRFPSDWNLKFAANEKFWKDYLGGGIDEDDFVAYMETISQGVPSFTVKKDGKDVFNQEALRYSNYMHDPEGRTYTGEEFVDLVISEIEKNQKALGAFSKEHPEYDETKIAFSAALLSFRNGVLGIESEKRAYADYESENYRWKADNKDGLFRIYDKSGTQLGAFFYSDLKIRADAASGAELLISEHGTMYDALPMDEELRKALTDILGEGKVKSEALRGYSVKVHPQTGIKYLLKDGEAGRGGKTLLTSPEDRRAFDALADRYLTKYPNLITDAREAAIYADLEILGLAAETEHGILTFGWDGASYHDDLNEKRNWSIRWNHAGDKYERLMQWFDANRQGGADMELFRSWKAALEEIGGYERLWSKEELKQGHLNS